jgi:polysaccharide biosynthesis protein PslJ
MSVTRPQNPPIVGMLGPVDGVGILTVFVVTLIAIPSRLIVGPLGSAGTPAQVICLCLLAWWAVTAVSVQGADRGPRQPIRMAMLIFVFAVFVSYLAMALRPTESAEARSGDAAVLTVCAGLGVLLTATDAIPNGERLDTLMRRLVAAAGALATLGVVQFATKQTLTNYIQIPGLRDNSALDGFISRNGYLRPAGTAIHPIEFGAVLTMCLPLALHYAFSDTHRPTLRRWFPVAAIALALPISISRSAVVSTIVVLCILVPSWSASRRHRVYLGVIAILTVMYLLVPGLLGTITGLFTGISSDSSTQSRTGSFGLALQFVDRAPFFGRGLGTFTPDYRILDDQYLGALIQTGIVGLVALIALFATGIREGFVIRHRSENMRDRGLALALAASVASAFASFATFDALSFPMAASLIFLILGCMAAHGRICGVRGRLTNTATGGSPTVDDQLLPAGDDRPAPLTSVAGAEG